MRLVSRSGTEMAPMRLNIAKFTSDRTQMEIFRECWKRHGNDKRTESKDV